MKIALLAPELKSKTGMPHYIKNLDKGLVERGHEVICADYVPDNEFDMAIINSYAPHLTTVKAKRVYQLVHSMNDCDKPIEGMKYIVPRQQVADHWGIEAEVMPIPIAIDPDTTYKIIAPCTFDRQRKPMLESLIERAKKDNVLLTLVGKNCGVLDELDIHDRVFILNEVPHEHVISLMRQYDEVAGLHVGTVTLEAWFLNKKTSVYDLDGNYEMVERPDNWYDHYYKKVAKQCEKL